MPDNSPELILLEEEAQHFVELDAALTRLESNPDFKKVILDEFISKETDRLVGLIANPNIIAANRVPHTLKALEHISALRNYFLKIKSFAANVKEERAREDEAARS